MQAASHETWRTAQTAGRFFPADPETLRREVAERLGTARRAGTAAPSRPRAVISPHAGYAFSGDLTATALAAGADWSFARIAILSPAHRHAFEGIALPAQAGYALPGARLAIDGAARDALIAAGLAQVLDPAHALEHGIETQLPFLAALHPDTPVVPLVIGWADTKQVAAVVDALAALPGETLYVLSSDLSHFLTQAEAVRRDAETAEKIEKGQFGSLTGQDACGARGIAGYLASATGRGARALRLGMTTSYATTGDAARVVGYGAWRLHAPDEATLAEDQRGTLLSVARGALAQRTAQGAAVEVTPARFAAPLQSYAASFVTLERDGKLRGCIGSLGARAPLVRDVAENTVRAGFADPRFDPVETQELERIAIKVSVLSRPARVDFDGEADARAALVPGETGAVLVDGRHRGVFLPQVWDSLPEPRAFLDGLKRKAGLSQDHWSDGLELHFFRGEVFAETV